VGLKVVVQEAIDQLQARYAPILRKVRAENQRGHHEAACNQRKASEEAEQ